MSGEDWTFWLMMVNYVLGIIVLLALAVVLGAVSWELQQGAHEEIHRGESLHVNAIGETCSLAVILTAPTSDLGHKECPSCFRRLE